MFKSLSIIAFVAFLACSSRAGQIVLGSDQTESSPFNSGYDKFIEDLLKEWHVPGIAIAVIHENQTWAKGYGYASLQDDESITPYTLFQGASTTKSYTASLAALLVENNDIYKDVDWTTPLHDIIGNEFVLSDSDLTRHVTLHDALSHRTGMPRHDAVWVNNEVSVAEEVHALRYLPPSAPLRTKWQYCNLMFTSVSHVIETLTGRWHGDVLREWLWEPLGMNNSYYSLADAKTCKDKEPQCKMATSYAWNNASQDFDEIAESSYHAANGAGGIISNVLDYSKWIRALMYENGPVPKAGHTAIKTPLSVETAEKHPYSGPVYYGMGLEGGIYRGEKVFGHGGDIGGYASHIYFLPEKKWGFVAFQNAGNFVIEIAAWRLLDEFLKTPKAEHAQVNEWYHTQLDEMEKEAPSLPSKLYPDVATVLIRPSLRLDDYAGKYHHPGYGFINITIGPPQSSSFEAQEPPFIGAASGPLYSKSRHENIISTLHHVSGEYWLVETRSHVHNAKIADGYTKARFEIGADGVVEKLGVVMEESVQSEQGWAWFRRV